MRESTASGFADYSRASKPKTTNPMSTRMDQSLEDGKEESFSYDQDMNKAFHFKWIIHTFKVL